MPKLVKENTDARFPGHWCWCGSIQASTPHGRSHGREKEKKKKKAKEIAREKRDKVEVRKEKERKKCRRQPTTTKVVGEVAATVWGIWCEQIYNNRIMVKNYDSLPLIHLKLIPKYTHVLLYKLRSYLYFYSKT